MQSFSTQEKIDRLISKMKIDWDRANWKNRGISRIEKDILADDIKKLYNLVYELDVSLSTQNFSTVEKSLEENAFLVNDPDLPRVDLQNEPKEDTVSGVENSLAGEKPEEQAEEPIDPIIETDETREMQFMDKETAFSQAPVELEINGFEPDENEISTEIQEAKINNPPPKTSENTKLETKVILDLFNSSKTLADVYQNDEDNNLAAKILQNKILDIKTAIGINDKFLFINQIFKGEMSTYNHAIEKLNQSSAFSDAIHIMEELKSNYGNEENKTSFNKLFEIAKRRFH